MEKQIEKMAKDIKGYVDKVNKGLILISDRENSYHGTGLAKHLIEQGCRKVVMCCECKYCEVVIDSIIDEPKYFCTKIANSIQVDPTDYCSRAKRSGRV